jgi:hypothetical protein
MWSPYAFRNDSIPKAGESGATSASVRGQYFPVIPVETFSGAIVDG